MTSPDTPDSPPDDPRTKLDEDRTLHSRGFRITVDGGRDSFYAICLEEPDSETAWIMSDTVTSLSDIQ